MHGVTKTTLVAHTIGIKCDTLTGNLAVFPLTLVGAAVAEYDDPDPMRLALGKFTLVDRPVGKARRALPLNLAFDPVAGILIAIRQGVGAGPVLKAVLERALVDATIVILLGAHLAVLRVECGGPDQCGANKNSGCQ